MQADENMKGKVQGMFAAAKQKHFWANFSKSQNTSGQVHIPNLVPEAPHTVLRRERPCYPLRRSRPNHLGPMGRGLPPLVGSQVKSRIFATLLNEHVDPPRVHFFFLLIGSVVARHAAQWAWLEWRRATLEPMRLEVRTLGKCKTSAKRAAAARWTTAFSTPQSSDLQQPAINLQVEYLGSSQAAGQ